MRIVIEEAEDGKEEEIIIRCHEVDEQLMQLIYGLKTGKNKLACLKQGAIYMVSPTEIYYFEAVDNKIFVYGKEQVYETKYKLYEIEEMYSYTDFFRASKSTILNLAKVRNVTPIFNGRFEALLDNGEKIIISRQFVPELKNKLGM